MRCDTRFKFLACIAVCALTDGFDRAAHLLERKGGITTTQDLVGWVARHMLPVEPAMRRWLRKAFPSCEVDDVVQETYCRIAAMGDLDKITDPRRYVFQTARNVALAELRRSRVVRIEAAGSAADLEAALAADELSPDRVVGGRWLLARVDALISALPARARTAIRLRKLDGLSQRQIAEQLGVPETTVENDLSRGLRAVLAGLTEGERDELPAHPRRMIHGRVRQRRG